MLPFVFLSRYQISNSTSGAKLGYRRTTVAAGRSGDRRLAELLQTLRSVMGRSRVAPQLGQSLVWLPLVAGREPLYLYRSAAGSPIYMPPTPVVTRGRLPSG